MWLWFSWFLGWACQARPLAEAGPAAYEMCATRSQWVTDAIAAEPGLALLAHSGRYRVLVLAEEAGTVDRRSWRPDGLPVYVRSAVGAEVNRVAEALRFLRSLPPAPLCTQWGSEGHIGDGYGFVWRTRGEVREVYLRVSDDERAYDLDVLPAPLRAMLASPATGVPVRPDEVEITWMWSNFPMGGSWARCASGPPWPGPGVVPRASLAAFAPDGCAVDESGELRTVGHWPASTYPGAVRAFEPYPFFPVAH